MQHTLSHPNKKKKNWKPHERKSEKKNLKKKGESNIDRVDLAKVFCFLISLSLSSSLSLSLCFCFTLGRVVLVLQVLLIWCTRTIFSVFSVWCITTCFSEQKKKKKTLTHKTKKEREKTTPQKNFRLFFLFLLSFYFFVCAQKKIIGVRHKERLWFCHLEASVPGLWSGMGKKNHTHAHTQ